MKTCVFCKQRPVRVPHGKVAFAFCAYCESLAEHERFEERLARHERVTTFVMLLAFSVLAVFVLVTFHG